MKNLKKTALVMALMATMFNHCEVLAAEKNNSQEEVQVFESEEKSKKFSSGKEMKAVNIRIDELNERIEEQRVTQEKILEMLEKIRTVRVKGASEENLSYNPAALVNPSSRRVSYTQDGANSQDNSTVIFKYAPNQLYKIYCRVGYLTDLSLKKGERITFGGGRSGTHLYQACGGKFDDKYDNHDEQAKLSVNPQHVRLVQSDGDVELRL